MSNEAGTAVPESPAPRNHSGIVGWWNRRRGTMPVPELSSSLPFHTSDFILPTSSFLISPNPYNIDSRCSTTACFVSLSPEAFTHAFVRRGQLKLYLSRLKFSRRSRFLSSGLGSGQTSDSLSEIVFSGFDFASAVAVRGSDAHASLLRAGTTSGPCPDAPTIPAAGTSFLIARC